MVPATKADEPLIIDILAQAFATNHSVQYVVQPGPGRDRRIRGLMRYAFSRCLRYGRVYLTEDRTGCALVLFPDRQRTTLSTLWADLVLAVSVIGITRIGKVLQRERRIHAEYPHRRLYYLWFVGVQPAAQHHGTGSRLLQELIKENRSMDRPMYLETSMSTNVPWYQRHGLTVYQQLPFAQPLYLMRDGG